MAYDKIIPLRARLDHCLDYVLNEDKTSLAMPWTMRKARRNRTSSSPASTVRPAPPMRKCRPPSAAGTNGGGILGYPPHPLLRPGEVTPEQAHAAGVGLPGVCWEGPL